MADREKRCPFCRGTGRRPSHDPKFRGWRYCDCALGRIATGNIELDVTLSPSPGDDVKEGKT